MLSSIVLVVVVAVDCDFRMDKINFMLLMSDDAVVVNDDDDGPSIVHLCDRSNITASRIIRDRNNTNRNILFFFRSDVNHGHRFVVLVVAAVFFEWNVLLFLLFGRERAVLLDANPCNTVVDASSSFVTIASLPFIILGRMTGTWYYQ